MVKRSPSKGSSLSSARYRADDQRPALPPQAGAAEARIGVKPVKPLQRGFPRVLWPGEDPHLLLVFRLGVLEHHADIVGRIRASNSFEHPPGEGTRQPAVRLIRQNDDPCLGAEPPADDGAETIGGALMPYDHRSVRHRRQDPAEGIKLTVANRDLRLESESEIVGRHEL